MELREIHNSRTETFILSDDEVTTFISRFPIPIKKYDSVELLDRIKSFIY